jgi:hypothetical protein
MVTTDLLKQYGFNEGVEELAYSAEPGKGAYYNKTGYPKPVKRYKIIWEAHDLSIEEPYYWIFNYFEQDLAFHNIIKTEDVFAAAENSAFFGVSQQRLGAQQDKVSQYLATIGKMVKELFQLVRELRILDERLVYYADTLAQLEQPRDRRQKSSEITLKGIFIDLVQGGAKNPASVYGMARELEFTTLPDLFFDAPPMNHDEVDSHVDALDFNRKVLEVLRRHRKQFIIWKERTRREGKTRRSFTLQYLRQHFEIIKMYMTWVRPYLRNVQRLTMRKGFEKEAELITSFETSMIDVEMLGYRPWGHYNAVIIATFRFRTRPSLKYVQEGYQRGPIHVGRMVMSLRGYVWTEKEIDSYVKMKQSEDFELLKSVSGAVKAAMDALGDELQKYLEEAGRLWEEKKHEKATAMPTKKGLFRDFLGSKRPPRPKREKKKKVDKHQLKTEMEQAQSDLKKRLWYVYKNYKKGHGMIAW